MNSYVRLKTERSYISKATTAQIVPDGLPYRLNDEHEPDEGNSDDEPKAEPHLFKGSRRSHRRVTYFAFVWTEKFLAGA